MDKINLQQKLSLFSEYWSPKIVGELNGQYVKLVKFKGELNGQYVKLVKFKGEFIWHKHEHEDELFFVIKGSFEMHYRDKIIVLNENELLIVPKGIEHKPVAREEVSVMLFEPASTLNTGDAENELTKHFLETI